MSNKERVGLAGAIISIVVGAFYVLSAILFLVAADDIGVFEYGVGGTVIAMMVVLILFSVAIVVVGSIFCAKRKVFGFAIALTIMLGILLILQIIGMTYLMAVSAMTIICFLAGIGAITLLIIYFCLKNPNSAAIATAAQVTRQEKNADAEKEQKILMLKQLKEHGDLTDEEYKDLLMKELQK